MQTFLPYSDFAASARVLDRARLGKQRLECLQLLRALTGATTGWTNHPAARMWRGHEHALCRYALAICDEWRGRGYRDQQREVFADLLPTLPDTGNPRWLGSADFHAAHRANLLRKDPNHYGAHGWTESPDLPYLWPEPKGVSDGE